ncbi:MAG: O-antigen ligase family protein [Prosthecobacter sp.]|uniref:O-antigen ligase family protein n=1 Tax=Prosthecobacter sp. TaxID=1965333 RepID=UPI0025CBEF87|nr:O-antigen ligase family protein [Prosthecobacter sp.]MCF7787949.1 O-antigen ligase family protein [Prosthecobacter sp.]
MKNLTPAFANEFATPELRRSVVGMWAGQIAVTGFVAGHACLPNLWLHLGWLLIAGVTALFCTEWTPYLRRWQADAGALSVVSFLLWMTLRSCSQIPFMPDSMLGEIMRGMVGTGLLMMFCMLVWQQAQSRESLNVMGWVAGITSALAALISIVLSYFVLPSHAAGERLTNLLVHGGLNPVCTGLIFGFAALWLAALMDHESTPLPRRLAWVAIALLHFAAFLSGSRGAMLALACGHAVLLSAHGWRRGRLAIGVFLLTGALYFTSAPLFARIAQWRSEPAAVTASAPGITDHFQKAVERGDNSRLDIYRAGLHAMDNHWLGTGQWGVCGIWQCELQAKRSIMMMSHLHSAFLSTFVHGGIIGAVLLLMALGFGIKRACRLAVQGDATWISLLAFGCGGLLFDGEALTSLATAPRFEGLLFWLPLTVALARGSTMSRSAENTF